MEGTLRTPLIDLFRRGEAARDVKLLAAQGGLAPRALEQLILLAILTEDSDPLVAAQAAATLEVLPPPLVAGLLARAEVSTELREFFATRGIQPADSPSEDTGEPLIDTLRSVPDVPAGGSEAEQSRVLSTLPITDRVKLAMKGTREQRAQLIRDPNKMVASAVLSSPKLTEAEVEAFCRMGNVSEDVLRVISTNRTWTKNYGVVLGLCKNAKTPPAISMQLLHRLNERDTKALSTDRNVPEVLRLAARKIVVKKLG
jgi:hypothetical protein